MKKPLIPRPTSQLGAIVELVVIVALAVGLALGIQAFIVKPYQIPSGSMEPTLDIGQRVLVNRLAYHFGDPSPGDVVVFHPPVSATAGHGPMCGADHPSDQACPTEVPQESSENFIKRIVAGPGDTVYIKHGIPYVNGTAFTGDFTTRPCAGLAGCDLTNPITIPPDHYFMMGDNRGHSEDSRFWGPVPRDWIIGKAFFTYWPPGRWGFL